jgi:transposase
VPADLPPAAHLIQSPYDVAARYRLKRQTAWTGYLVHVTETCDAATPHLLTHVETTPATTADMAVTAPVQAALATKGLPPAEHVVDSGYVDATLLVTSARDYGITLVGPMHPDVSWQAQTPGAFDLTRFTIDWDHQTVTCPQGQANRTWSPSHDTWGNAVIHVGFAAATCRACPVRAACTRAATGPRTLKLRPRAEHEALQAARAEQATPAFQARYAIRAGIESTLSQGVRAFELRRSRYIGVAKTHLQHVATAAAIDLARLEAWWTGGTRAPTRQSSFATLAVPV